MKSGLFYFGDTFYSDMRVITCQDYGAVVHDWMKNNRFFNQSAMPLEHKLMEDSKIEDLEIRLGFPYVFVHSGKCEHVIVFLGAR